MSSEGIKTLVILDQASGYLKIDMLKAYALKYPNRAIVAGTIVERGSPLPKEVRWHKIVRYNRSTSIRRLVTWLAGTFGMFWVVFTRYRNAHIVAITNPPFSIFVPWLLRAKSYDVVVYDMYPDALAHYGYVKKSSVVYRSWAYLNKRVFEKANRVITLTEGMERLVNYYMPKDRSAEVIHLWSDAQDFKNIPREENEILKQTSTQDKFVIVYSGNLGKTHPVEKLIELAEYLDSKKYAIIIIGDGAKKRVLKEFVTTKKLSHVHLLPWQPAKLLSHNLYAGHINAVTLDEEAGDLSIPSKTFNILSVGNPVLGICEESSDLAKLILENKCGLVSRASEMKNLAQRIIQLHGSENEYLKMKENSLRTSKKFSKENANKYI